MVKPSPLRQSCKPRRLAPSAQALTFLAAVTVSACSQPPAFTIQMYVNNLPVSREQYANGERAREWLVPASGTDFERHWFECERDSRLAYPAWTALFTASNYKNMLAHCLRGHRYVVD